MTELKTVQDHVASKIFMTIKNVKDEHKMKVTILMYVKDLHR